MSGEPNSDNDQESVQSLDDKLNTILNILQKNAHDIQEKKWSKMSSIEFCHAASINDLKQITEDKKIGDCNGNMKQILARRWQSK